MRPVSTQSREESHLRVLEAELAEKRAVYTETHQRIRALKARIASLEAALPAPMVDADTQEGALAQQIAQLDNQIQLLRDQQQALEANRTAIQQTIQRTSNIEIQLNALFRRHQELQDQYGVIVRKRTEAETGEKLEVNQQAERFELIETAIAPNRPISPNRTKIVIMGSVASLVAAAGFAFLIEMLRPAIRTSSQMQRQLGLRPVVTIPYIRTRSEHRRLVLRYAFGALVIGVGLPGLLYGIDQYVMPLELLGTKIAERSGANEFIRMVETRF